MNPSKTIQALGALVLFLSGCAAAPPVSRPVGEIKGSRYEHSQQSAVGVIETAQLVLPPVVTGGLVYAGPLRDAPRELRGPVPLVVFMHGSSGLALQAIGEWQRWLAGLGVASLAPNSFALTDRLTYKSPVSAEVYEKVHALRTAEIGLALQAVQGMPWVDKTRMVLAGTSEGATAVARHSGSEFVGRMVYSWSCENNYFVRDHATDLRPDRPVLNVMSSSDIFFSPSNTWLGNPAAKGHCGDALKTSKGSSVVLIPGAPHTLINLPPARHATEGFLKDLLKL
jgi:dienelactone hydrolase